MNNKNSIGQSALRVYLVVTSILTIPPALALFFSSTYSFTSEDPQPLAPLLALTGLLIFLTISIGLLRIFRGIKIDTALQVALWIPSLLIIPAASLVLIGLGQDSAKTHCSGFYGSGSSCGEEGFMTLAIVIQMIPIPYIIYGLYCGLVLGLEFFQQKSTSHTKNS